MLRLLERCSPLRLQSQFHFARQCHGFLSEERVFDVIVVGGGHAGVEACCAAARMGAKTLLVTHKKETIGEMSCNPSFGGIGKGHLMKEIDALDGICARVCDRTGINYKILNKSKGPAVWGPRAQIDRKLYKKEIQKELFLKTPNLTTLFTSVEDLLVDYESQSCHGIITKEGYKIHSKTVVLTTGTFLNGQINIGLDIYPAGRIGDEPSIPLASTLKRLNFKMGRLKTGTPPRLKKTTVDFKACEKQEPDYPPIPFSFLSEKVWIKPENQLFCYLTYTNEKVGKIILENMHLNRHVKEEITGPRYCPSIESKYLRFKNKRHFIWLEPEGLDSDVIYPAGLSCTLPEELQVDLVRQMKGLENVEIVRPGYGVEYDFVDPRELKTSLETIKISNLFFAGQINGTTGYEEAAAQGIMAGVNAAAKGLRKADFVLSRSEAYIGVLIDDLTRHGTSEPYRMFTSRAEFRLHLRADNADLRLTRKGFEAGCVGEERLRRAKHVEESLKIVISQLKSVTKTMNQWKKVLKLPGNEGKPLNKSGFEILNVYYSLMKMEDVKKFLVSNFGGLLKDDKLCERVIIEAVYESALQSEIAEIEEIKKEEAMKIPTCIDYGSDKLSLSEEDKEKLEMARPQTIAAASRIPGVSPTSLIRLMKYLKSYSSIVSEGKLSRQGWQNMKE